MRQSEGSAPGKIILFGEHAVVYGRPAVAIPFNAVEARATVDETPAGGLVISAPDIGDEVHLGQDTQHPLAVMAQLVLETLNADAPNAHITIHSAIPVASGLGSGAAVSAALGRALSDYLGQPLPTPQLSSLVFEVETLYHGTPSGIDNTVVCYGQPVTFVKGRSVEPLHVREPFRLAVADTGIPSATKESVGAVRAAWEKDGPTFEALFDEVGKTAADARAAIESGRAEQLGPLMTHNQEILRRLGVSSPELERLIGAALSGGATGAKLSGGGRGGNMIALVEKRTEARVLEALRNAGAAHVWATTVNATS
jgi:mevalonate kinase